MNALRPLATIAILAVMGVFLAMKIQQDRNLPPIADSEAPAFDGASEAPPALTPTDSSLEPRTAPSAAPAKAVAPTLPPLPTLPAPLPSSNSTTPSAPLESVPEAPRYDKIASPTQIAPPAISGRVPSLGTATPDFASQAPKSTTPAAATAFPTIAPAPTNPVTTAVAPSQPELGIIPPATNQTAAPPTNITPILNAANSGYAAARPVIQAALDRDELPRAHLLLTQWYGDPGLSADEKREVQQLLSELAGSVVYSTENRLEPAYTVKPGDTLETIATAYQVPWQLLAKINGVAKSDGVQPGQTLSVLKGPFTAVVDLSERELVLMLAGRYAGRFPVEIQGAAANDSQWRVEQKLQEPSQSNPYAGYDPAIAPTFDRRIVLRDPVANATVELIAQSAAAQATSQHQGRITVAASDAEDLYDILSVGSEVVVRR